MAYVLSDDGGDAAHNKLLPASGFTVTRLHVCSKNDLYSLVLQVGLLLSYSFCPCCFPMMSNSILLTAPCALNLSALWVILAIRFLIITTPFYPLKPSSTSPPPVASRLARVQCEKKTQAYSWSRSWPDSSSEKMIALWSPGHCLRHNSHYQRESLT